VPRAQRRWRIYQDDLRLELGSGKQSPSNLLAAQELFERRAKKNRLSPGRLHGHCAMEFQRASDTIDEQVPAKIALIHPVPDGNKAERFLRQSVVCCHAFLL